MDGEVMKKFRVTTTLFDNSSYPPHPMTKTIDAEICVFNGDFLEFRDGASPRNTLLFINKDHVFSIEEIK